MYFLQALQHDLNWHVAIHCVIQAKQCLFNLSYPWFYIVLLHARDNLWRREWAESCGSHCRRSRVVCCVDDTFEDGDERQLNFFQGVLSILGDLQYLLSNYLFCIGEGVRWDLEK